MRFGARAGGLCRIDPSGSCRGVAANERHDAVRQCHPTPWRAHDFKLGRRRFAARDSVERARGAARVSVYRLIDALGHNRVTDGIDRIA